MPIEIRELVIKTAVVQEGGGAQGGQSGTASGNGVSVNEEMIHLCLEKMNDIMKDKNER